MKSFALIIVSLLLAPPVTASDGKLMKILIAFGSSTVEATLKDNPAARDLFSMLPLTVTLEDYASTEKIAYLPRRLVTTDSPAGFTASTGDLAYYAPWGNLAIFYRDGKYAAALVHLGRIDSGLDALKTSSSQKITISRSVP
jgi:hypothetical protein